MNSTPMSRVLPILLTLLLLPLSACAQEKPATHVLIVGNSLVYTNNLAGLFNSLAAAQPQPQAQDLRADMLVAAGGSLAERRDDGGVARAIDSGRWQVLVLQERGGVLACLDNPKQREENDCRGSVNAHRALAALAKKRGMRVILLGTWGPDAIWQGQLSRGVRRLAAKIDAEAVDAGPVLRDYASEHPTPAMFQDDILHPTLDGSLILAGLLYRQVSGHVAMARALQIDAPLYPVRIRPDGTRLTSEQTDLPGERGTKITAERLEPLLLVTGAVEDKK